ncbi:MAG: PilN domain-containing protein [Gaiellaceae bacterium]
MRAVNLLPVERRGGSSRSSLGFLTSRPLVSGASALGVVVVAVLALLVHSSSSAVSAKRQQLDTLKTQVAALPAAKPVASSTGSSTTASRLAAVTTVAGQRMTWDAFLGAFSRVLPEDVWLLSLTADSSAAAATPATTVTPGTAPTAFTLTGYTYSQPSVARLMKRLSLLPWLQDVSLISSSRKVIGDKTVYQMTVNANIVKTPEVGS